MNRTVQELLRRELIRRLNRYALIDRRFCQKYGMDFESFRRQGTVEREGYRFDVESDYCDWEMAVTSMEALSKRLSDLEEEDVRMYR